MLLNIFCLIRFFRLHYYPDILSSVHFYGYRFLETHMTDVLRLVKGFAVVKKLCIVTSVAPERVYGEISHAQRSEILEKMCALARVDTVLLQSGFHNNACHTYLRPFYRYAEPMIA